MRGVKITAALSAALVCVWLATSAAASGIDGVRNLARQKAAAVEILKTKAADAVVTLAQDRLFIAYLNATTQGEGARLRQRIAQVLGTLVNRFGLRAASLIDRSGEFVVRAGAAVDAGGEKTDVKRETALTTGFAAKPFRVVSTVTREDGGWAVTLVAPVNWRGQNEFVLRTAQPSSAYQQLLSRDVGRQRFVLLLDADGRVLADSRGAGGKTSFSLAGLSLAQIRAAVKGTAQEGAGQVSPRDQRFNVGYRAVDAWTLIAVEAVLAPRRCGKTGERLCG